jgi:hypothetical protein
VVHRVIRVNHLLPQDYKPSMFTDKLFSPHPEKLQETSALANAIPLPHDYKLHLPLRTMKDGLTAAQLETSCPPFLTLMF